MESTIKTDLEVRLRTLLSLVNCVCDSMNTITMQTLSVGIATEAMTLTLKLQSMLSRWHVYLPFHECIGVDFRVWLTLFEKDVRDHVKQVNEVVASVRSMSGESDKACRARDYQALNVFHENYVVYLSEKLKDSSSVSDMELEMKIKPWIDTCFKMLGQQPFMAYSLDMALECLIDALQQIDDFFSSEFSEEQFRCLSHRLYHRLCPSARKDAKQEIHCLKNSWPAHRCKERAQRTRAELIEEVRQTYASLTLDDYIDIERPNPLEDVEFGRFLFVNRNQLTKDEVVSLFLDLYRIQALNCLIDPQGAEADLSAVTLNEERKVVYHRLKDLVQRAEWKEGMTADRVLHCFAQLLLPPSSQAKTPVIDSEYTAMFWRLLLCRRGCEEDYRSLKITWLNLVGYFRSRRCLKGGSPTLCSHFFPNGTPEGRHNDRDYNAIGKGAGDRAGNDFHDLIGILDQLLGLEPPK